MRVTWNVHKAAAKLVGPQVFVLQFIKQPAGDSVLLLRRESCEFRDGSV
jgi:hypothetical protein